MKLYKLAQKFNKLTEKVEDIPWKVWTSFWETKPVIDFVGDQVSFGSDYKTIKEMRTSVEWLAEQFGGKITWED